MFSIEGMSPNAQSIAKRNATAPVASSSSTTIQDNLHDRCTSTIPNPYRRNKRNHDEAFLKSCFPNPEKITERLTCDDRFMNGLSTTATVRLSMDSPDVSNTQQVKEVDSGSSHIEKRTSFACTNGPGNVSTLCQRLLESNEGRKNNSMNRGQVAQVSHANATALVIAASDKAGMQGIDREAINAIILRESANSLYMQQQHKRDAAVDLRIATLREKLAQQQQLKPQIDWKKALQREIDQEIPSILQQRPLRSTSVVVDMDMFYMACEFLDKPELKEVPACVGGQMILTSNYLARRYGVRSAMAGWIGDCLVRELSHGKQRLVHVPSHFDLYKLKSEQVRHVLAEYDPHLQSYSLDEAYIQIGPYLACKLDSNGASHEQIRSILSTASKSMDQSQAQLDQASRGKNYWEDYHDILLAYPTALCMQVASSVIMEMRERVTKATGGLTCSAGCAPNFLLAKIASDINKPNGQLLVDSNHNSIMEGFLFPLPIRKVPGIGRVSEKILQAFGIDTIRDLYDHRALVRFLFQKATAGFLLRASIGCSSSSSPDTDADLSDPHHQQKGISRERTFRPGQSWTQIHSKLEDIGQLLAADMERKSLRAHSMTIKVKLHTFDCLSKTRTLPRGVLIHTAKELIEHATELLHDVRQEAKANKSFSVRLLGIRCFNFQMSHCDDGLCDNDGGIPYYTQRTLDTLMSPTSIEDCVGQSLCVDGQNRSACRAARAIFSPRSISATGTGPTTVTPSTASCNMPSKSTIGSTHISEYEQASCPICGASIRPSDNEAVNRHIDTCLNSSTA